MDQLQMYAGFATGSYNWYKTQQKKILFCSVNKRNIRKYNESQELDSYSFLWFVHILSVICSCDVALKGRFP